MFVDPTKDGADAERTDRRIQRVGLGTQAYAVRQRLVIAHEK
jgi:hypothetical protein